MPAHTVPAVCPTRMVQGVLAPATQTFLLRPMVGLVVAGAPEGGNPSTKGTTLDCPFSQRVMMTLGVSTIPLL